jgi:hypothetical protein
MLYNESGQAVKKTMNISGHEIKIERDNLSSGVYVICLMQNKNIITTKKVVIKD